MIADYLRLSVRNLTKRKTRTYLTMIGIFIGIATVVSLIGLGEGLRNAISAQFGFLGSDVLSVQASGLDFAGPPGSGVIDPLTEDLTDKIENLNGVELAVDRYIESGTLEFNDRQSIIFAWNVPEGENRKPFEKMINLGVQEGRLLKDGDTFKAIIGSGLAEGDEFEKEIQIGNRISFKGKTLEVVGIIEKKGSFIFDTAIVLNENILLNNFRDNDNVDTIAVKVKDVDNIDNVQENIEKLLRKRET